MDPGERFDPAGPSAETAVSAAAVGAGEPLAVAR
jgi:hypothetical protein